MWVMQLKIYPDKKPSTMPIQLWTALGKTLEKQFGVADPEIFKES